eukprot:TRINITY_DN6673_c1_g1_i1.p1 TRINITY_DN6673_c1_g1~~TRINITY_DN6673_c1_g1_i1.p1  ORF type:complete len:263 (+),score=52.22 TRINITY_DN6673_c1_g1_i1:58-789(+)
MDGSFDSPFSALPIELLNKIVCYLSHPAHYSIERQYLASVRLVDTRLSLVATDFLVQSLSAWIEDSLKLFNASQASKAARIKEQLHYVARRVSDKHELRRNKTLAGVSGGDATLNTQLWNVCALGSELVVIANLAAEVRQALKDAQQQPTRMRHFMPPNPWMPQPQPNPYAPPPPFGPHNPFAPQPPPFGPAWPPTHPPGAGFPVPGVFDPDSDLDFAFAPPFPAHPHHPHFGQGPTGGGFFH